MSVIWRMCGVHALWPVNYFAAAWFRFKAAMQRCRGQRVPKLPCRSSHQIPGLLSLHSDGLFSKPQPYSQRRTDMHGRNQSQSALDSSMIHEACSGFCDDHLWRGLLFPVIVYSCCCCHHSIDLQRMRAEGRDRHCKRGQPLSSTAPPVVYQWCCAHAHCRPGKCACSAQRAIPPTAQMPPVVLRLRKRSIQLSKDKRAARKRLRSRALSGTDGHAPQSRLRNSGC